MMMIIKKKIPNKQQEYKKLNSLDLNFNADFDFIKINIMGDEDVLNISNGEVTKIDTLNYRTLKTEKNGIFCASIFGPTEDNKCACRKYIGEMYIGIRCEKCNIFVGSRALRRIHFGHIALETTVIHPWFYNYVCSILQMTKSSFMSIIEYMAFICIEDTFDGKYKFGEIFTAKQYYEELYLYDTIIGGGEAIHALVKRIDIEKEYKTICSTINSKTLDEIADKEIRRRDILKMFIQGKTDINTLFITVIPVSPADLRPIIYLESGGVATVDINELYKKIISRNNRLKQLIALEQHKLITNSEKVMIHQAVCQLMGPQKAKTFKSIAECIKGKKGHFRRMLLGKRTDFSGRAAIGVGPQLNINECIIPYIIARELFRIFLYTLLIRRKFAYSLIEAKRIVDNEDPIIFNLMTELAKDFPILLNRAPTLHKFGLQAFNMSLSMHYIIQIHPLVCTGYNADFDGDQMACHLPITIGARTEAYTLMLSSNNLFLPSNGRIILLPSKDIVMGIYYITCEGSVYKHKHILSLKDLIHMCNIKVINKNTVINYLIKDIKGSRVVQTTYGRLIIWNELNNHHRLDFDRFNKRQDKKVLGENIIYIFHNNGWKDTVNLLNFFTQLGFKALTESGISYTMDDMTELDNYNSTLDEINNKLIKMRKHLDRGLITEDELNHEIINTWNTRINKSGDELIKKIENDDYNCDDTAQVKGNNVYLMYISGARGSKSQIQQVCTHRGFVARPSGKVSTYVIKSNLKGGLKVLEFFKSTHGERKGLSDTAIKTSKSGHFTRRLVDVANSVIIHEKDCKTTESLEIHAKKDKRHFNINFFDAIFSRILAKPIYKNDKLLFPEKTAITESVYETIVKENIQSVHIYSILFCKSSEVNENHVCAQCYGIDLSTYNMVDIGTAVGIVAAQSIGEPGTQLTMRTTHTGGIAQTGASEVSIVSHSSGFIDLSGVHYIINSDNESIVFSQGVIIIKSKDGEVLEEIAIKNEFILTKRDGEEIFENDIIAYKNNTIINLYSTMSGVVTYQNFVLNVTYKEIYDADTGITRLQIINQSRGDYKSIPAIIITNDSGEETCLLLKQNMLISVQENQVIKKGDIVAKSYVSTLQSHDIVGGLPKVIDLFEVKKHQNKAILAPCDGLVKIEYKNDKKQYIVRILSEENQKVLYKQIIPINKQLLAYNDTTITRGSMITNGNIGLQDLLDIMGYSYMAKYFIGEVSAVYEDQGANINYKHYEIILKQMTKNGIVLKVGQSKKYNIGEINVKHLLAKEHTTLQKNKKSVDNPFIYKTIILSITKIAIQYCQSFISSASFQNTIPVIATNAIKNATDHMYGIKESSIFGKAIPCGTGCEQFSYFMKNKLKRKT